jgi:putative membrane protein
LIPLAAFPGLDAGLNAATAVLLLCGYAAIRRGRIRMHRAFMIAAFATAMVFLCCYLWYHAHAGSRHFPGQGTVRAVYLGILLTHTVLAAAIVPLAIVTLRRGLGNRHPAHERLARWTLPIWLYVSVTGVVVYWMLYRMRW